MSSRLPNSFHGHAIQLRAWSEPRTPPPLNYSSNHIKDTGNGGLEHRNVEQEYEDWYHLQGKFWFVPLQSEENEDYAHEMQYHLRVRS